MSSPILGDSPSLNERPGGKQSKHMSLKKHDTGIPMNTPTDPNSVIPDDDGSTDHVMPTQGPRCHHQSPRGEHCSEAGWGPEFFPNCEYPGTPTEMDSPTCYERFVSAPQSGPLQGPRHGTSRIQKRRGRPERYKMNGNASRITSCPPVTPRIESALQSFEKELRLLEEQNRTRLKASQENSSQKNG
ncbi:hypothetical protein B0T10DRAFT_468105 [Thelonectria olida]|uniref:Uncharacterized protein n=1 Tax=Thelonectria olida TaxID=1576542 RepID=A0A9P9AHG9_9HYPO|nr:hypothetical protein B0T10DRAFT_468105 [Thelonectria olida]